MSLTRTHRQPFGNSFSVMADAGSAFPRESKPRDESETPPFVAPSGLDVFRDA
jgi:hypothetical protein